MPLADRVRVARRFQRAIRIDTDLGLIGSALVGFVCPHSFGVLLENMARHVSENNQGAFTWTGPYGSGKSSLAVALSALLKHDKSTGRQAARLSRERDFSEHTQGAASAQFRLAYPSHSWAPRPTRAGCG